MAKKSIWRDKFDPTAGYVVAKRPLLFGGRTYEVDELFNPSTTERQMRILYDGRHIDKATGDHSAEIIPPFSKYLVQTRPGWFDVLDQDRKPINDKRLRIKAAKEMVLQ